MSLELSTWITVCLGFITVITALLVALVQWNLSYWQRRGIPTAPSKFFFGHTEKFMTQRESFSDLIQRHYDYFKELKKRHAGIYTLMMPAYMPIDPKIIRSVLQTDFDHFTSRGMYVNETGDPLSAHLFSLEGSKWKNLRSKLTPTFTSGKMKMMFDVVIKCSESLVTAMEREIVKDCADIKQFFGRYTTDVIGNVAFGVECDSLNKPDNDFSKYFDRFFLNTFWDNINLFLCHYAQNVARTLGLKAVKPSVSKFFINFMKRTVEYREKNNIFRRDFLHLLLQLKNKGRLEDNNNSITKEADTSNDVLSFNEVAAQAFVFFIAGYETSSSTMVFCLYELASNQEIQEKLRNEINTILPARSSKLSYEAINTMNYLAYVINETLRKYPPIPILMRECNKNYQIPDTNVTLEKGTKVFIPVIAMQRDPEYYPEPEKFIPERFENASNYKQNGSIFMPFGEGPRICIGSRFGLMQVKIGIIALIRNFSFTLNSRTKTPLTLDHRNVLLTPSGGIWCDYKRV